MRSMTKEELGRVRGGQDEWGDYIIDTNDDSGYDLDSFPPWDDGSFNITIWAPE